MSDERSEKLGYPRIVAYGDDVHLVFEKIGWEGDRLVSVWLDKDFAEKERDRLNKERADLNGELLHPDDPEEHYVQTVKLGEKIR